jgi:hypothetical protein
VIPPDRLVEAARRQAELGVLGVEEEVALEAGDDAGHDRLRSEAFSNTPLGFAAAASILDFV